MRLVWDAAAKIGKCSLNTFLLKGPDLVPSLLGILLRLRQHRVAYTGDIEKMFNQIQITPEDQMSQLQSEVDHEKIGENITLFYKNNERNTTLVKCMLCDLYNERPVTYMGLSNHLKEKHQMNPVNKEIGLESGQPLTIAEGEKQDGAEERNDLFDENGELIKLFRAYLFNYLMWSKCGYIENSNKRVSNMPVERYNKTMKHDVFDASSRHPIFEYVRETQIRYERLCETVKNKYLSDTIFPEKSQINQVDF